MSFDHPIPLTIWKLLEKLDQKEIKAKENKIINNGLEIINLPFIRAWSKIFSKQVIMV